MLQEIRDKYSTKRGNRMLCDLVDLAISSLDVCTWRREFATGPLPIKHEPRKLSEAQRQSLARAREAKAAQEHAHNRAVSEARLRGRREAARPASRAGSTERTSSNALSL